MNLIQSMNCQIRSDRLRTIHYSGWMLYDKRYCNYIIVALNKVYGADTHWIELENGTIVKEQKGLV